METRYGMGTGSETATAFGMEIATDGDCKADEDRKGGGASLLRSRSKLRSRSPGRSSAQGIQYRGGT
jgi:hypothetical protein